MSLNKLDMMPKPFAFLDYEGYWQSMKTLLDRMAGEGFVWKEWVEKNFRLSGIWENWSGTAAKENRGKRNQWTPAAPHGTGGPYAGRPAKYFFLLT